MIRSLWIAKTGLDAQQTNLDVISNNLANGTTTGYKRVKPMFEDLLYQTIRQAGGPTNGQAQSPSGLQLGAGVRTAATERVHIQGALNQTQNPLDLSIYGKGFFQINLPDGTTAYTRDGNFTRDANGQMVSSAGYVLAPGVTIPADATSIAISETGTVSVTLPGQVAPQNVGEIQLANFINPAGLTSIGGNLYLETAASGATQQGAPGSNGIG
ncbi:MAG: flagellar basal-body rod protein FlgG, partial [Betaproteobacteria bacterium]|nr:flagellar basal-body rod protein FlgG [Betaproteobacteria bacterium]